MTRALAFTAALVIPCFTASAQAPAFDVVSIKRNTSGLPGPLWGGTPSRWQMINGPVSSLIYTAYDPQVSELPGAPAWVFSDKYDVTGTMRDSSTREMQGAMLRTMLADRFKLKARLETQERPVYALVVARPGRLGPELRPSSQDCAAADAKCGMSLGGGRLTATGRMLDTINSVGRIDGRVIVDKTGLKGLYDFTLRYSMQPGPNDDTPSIFAAVEEQLGLRLVPDRAPLTVVIVDYIERPTPD
jgi:uncharacterized protein (TIGR03435 family)